MKTPIWKRLTGLKALSFALMLGAGLVMTLLAVWLITILGYGAWPEGAADERVDGLAKALWITLGINALVVIALAWGKLDSLKFGNGIWNAEVDFDDEEPPKAQD